MHAEQSPLLTPTSRHYRVWRRSLSKRQPVPRLWPSPPCLPCLPVYAPRSRSLPLFHPSNLQTFKRLPIFNRNHSFLDLFPKQLTGKKRQ
jgi:hypothetical protein